MDWVAPPPWNTQFTIFVLHLPFELRFLRQSHHLASSSFSAYARKNHYTTFSTHDITINNLPFTTLGGNYLWLIYFQLNSCHIRHAKKEQGIYPYSTSSADLPARTALILFLAVVTVL